MGSKKDRLMQSVFPALSPARFREKIVRARHPSRSQFVRAIILVLAFLCWAKNQLLGDGRLSTLFNDLALGVFVFDVFPTVIGWPLDGEQSPEWL